MIVNWNEFIRLAVISNDLQPVTKAEREELKREIDQQTGKINEFTTEVDSIKLENLETFKKIEDILKSHKNTREHQEENQLKSELKPTPLTVNSSLSDAITFLRNFSTYILSGNGELDQLPEGMIAGIVRINVDNFWMKMLEGWGFGEQTTLQEFISMGNEISKNRSSVYDRRVELFGLKHTVLDHISESLDTFDTFKTFKRNNQEEKYIPECSNCFEILLLICQASLAM